MNEKGQEKDKIIIQNKRSQGAHSGALVLEKSIFSNVFEKDIRRAFIYNKSERIAKALHLIAPAFKDTSTLRARVERLSMALVDAALLPPSESKKALSAELLALSSILAIAKSAGLLSPMNVAILLKEVHVLLEEVALYEEPQVSLEAAPSLAEIARDVRREPLPEEYGTAPAMSRKSSVPLPVKELRGEKTYTYKGHIKDKEERRESIVSAIRSKGQANIKDIAIRFRDVSEKTIQRELISLVEEGVLKKTGERRWSAYSLAS